MTFVKSAAISSMEDPLKLLTNLKSLKNINEKIENSDKLKEKSETETESNSSLRRLLGLKDFGSESMDEEE